MRLFYNDSNRRGTCPCRHVSATSARLSRVVWSKLPMPLERLKGDRLVSPSSAMVYCEMSALTHAGGVGA